MSNTPVEANARKKGGISKTNAGDIHVHVGSRMESAVSGCSDKVHLHTDYY